MIALLIKTGIIKYIQKKLEKKWKALKVDIDHSHRHQPEYSFMSKKRKKIFASYKQEHMKLIEERKQVSNKIRTLNKLSKSYKGYTSPGYMGQD